MEGPKWQTEHTTVRDRNRYAFDHSLFCDIEFSVLDSNKEKVGTFKAHKYVLAISSPVFEAMFYGELAETGPTIDLPDCTKEGLQEMLHYVYSDEVNLTGRNVMDVLYLAQKYMMPYLENKCSEYLQKDLRPEDVFIVLPQAQEVKNEKAEMCCWNIVDFETERAVRSELFLDISRELLCQVLERETLHVEEIELFKAIDKWASNQIEEEELKNDGATKREILGEKVIRLLRFPVISEHEFAEFVIDSSILTLAETNEYIKVLTSTAAPQTLFNADKRKGQWSEKWSPNRFQSLKGNGNQVKEASQRHCIQIQVNKPIYLAGVKMFGAQFQDTKIKLTIAKGIETPALLGSGVSFGSGFSFGSSQASYSAGSLFGSTSKPRAKSQRKTGQKIPITTPFSAQENMFSRTTTTSPLVFKHTYTKLTHEGTANLIDESYHGFELIFAEELCCPVPLEPNEWYFIHADLSGECSLFAGSEGLDAVKCDDVTVKFKSVDDNATTVQTGQFPSFLFQRKMKLL